MKITTGYQPGVIGRVTQMQIDYYASHHGFGAHFERRIATELAELVGRLDNPRNAIFCNEYEVWLSSGESMYILAANSEEAAWDALELSMDRKVTLVNVFRTHEW